MVVTHLYTLICDDIRREDNGKFIVIGLYTPHISVPQIPFAMPTLSFVTAFRAEGGAAMKCDFKFTLQHLESGKQMAEGMGSLQTGGNGMGIVPIKLGNLQLSQVGPHAFTFQLLGQQAPEPIVTTFDVVLRLPKPAKG